MCIEKFIYFAYGSNLLLKRIHINNPSATRIGIGKLKDYRLGFYYKSKRWNGAAATIVPEPGNCVWGALWELSYEHMKTLDKQEGVSARVYEPITVKVDTTCGKTMECRTYQLVNLPPRLEPGEPIPLDQQPSKVYLDTIIEGAEETGLPEYYIKSLKDVKHNGYCGPVLHECD